MIRRIYRYTDKPETQHDKKKIRETRRETGRQTYRHTDMQRDSEGQTHKDRDIHGEIEIYIVAEGDTERQTQINTANRIYM